MIRFVKALPVAVAILASGPASAAVTYGVMCQGGGSFKQVIREGTGDRELRRGTGSVAAWCAPAKAVQTIKIGLQGPAFDTLKAIAATPAADDVLVHTRIEWIDADTPQGEATRTAIGWQRERTFGDLRKELSGLAQPTGEYVDDTGYRTYRAPSCAEPLIPIRYYITTKAPFPGCDGGRLVQDGETTTIFD